jgi:hypothetical protein
LPPITLPAASGIRPRYFTWLTCAMAVLAVCYFGHLTAQWSGHPVSGIRILAAESHRTIRVGDRVFRIPQSQIRSPAPDLFNSSAIETHPSVEIAAVWPAMSVNHAETAAIPVGPAPRIVELKIGTIEKGKTLRETLVPVYMRLARRDDASGPAGLRILTLSESGSALDRIVYEPGAKGGFVARCQQGDATPSAVCTAQLPLTRALWVTYRFEEKLLANWGLLERRIINLIRSLAVTAQKTDRS